MQEMISKGQRPQPPQTLIDHDALERMGTLLVQKCDNMEKHGLVDYQMGVWEEEIIASMYTRSTCLHRSRRLTLYAVLTTCLDLWEEAGVGSGAHAPSASTSRRR